MHTNDPDITELTRRLANIELEHKRLNQEITTLRQHIEERRKEDKTGRDPFEVGDRVRINTRIVLPRKVTERDRIGTVTRITKHRIQITTDASTNTRRAPGSLTNLSR